MTFLLITIQECNNTISSQGSYGIKNFKPGRYRRYLVSCAGGKKEKKAAKQTAREAIRYLATVKSAAFWEDCFLDHHSLRHYVDSLQKGPEPLTAGTVAEKIRQLKLAIEYII